MKRISGWPRVGIILSIIWFLVGGLYARGSIVDTVGEQTIFDVDACIDQNKTRFGEKADFAQVSTPCWDQWSDIWHKHYDASGGWWPVLTVVAITTVTGWLIDLLLLSILRWIWIRTDFSKL